MTEFSVSVTDLARFCHRHGDIDQRFNPSPSGPEGIAGHQRLYSRRPESYRREYPVESRYELDGIALHLRGRADGYDAEAGLVEEIKTCRIEPDSIPPAIVELQLSQGLIYAAIIADRENLSALRVRITWLNIDNEKEHYREDLYPAAALRAFLQDTLSRFAGWLQLISILRKQRDASIATLTFPYGEFRAGQRDIAETTYKCIASGRHLLMEAPTGIGKTAAVLFPALKALMKGKHERIAFVTAKTIGRRSAEQTLAHFRAAGYRGTALSLSAKEAVCLSPGKACHGEDCPYAKGYYEKLPNALHAAMKAPALTRVHLESLAREFEVCPYELAGDLLPWVDTVIGDQHYVYSLYGALGGLMGASGARWSVLLDEAHNLPGRARKMYSARLSKYALMRAKREAPARIVPALERVNRKLLALQKQDWQSAQYHSEHTLPQTLLGGLIDFAAAVSADFAETPGLLSQHPVLAEFYFDSLHFIRVAQQWGDEYRCVYTRDTEPQSLLVVLNCLDPARLLAERQARAYSVTAFSATLSPPEWTRERLGLDNHTVFHRASSPFTKDQLAVWLVTDLDTRYRHREDTLQRLASLLKEWLEAMPGNGIVYFPSYRYMHSCLRLLDDLEPRRTLWVQAPQECEERRAELLRLLQEKRDMVAFCILGGIFSEGIDLPGDALASVAVVGVGMPQVNQDTRDLQEWYEQRTGAGFQYTFVYPGLQKVDQALGRVVRSALDKGNALLIDTRYGQPQYRQLLPPWWVYRQWPPQRPQ